MKLILAIKLSHVSVDGTNRAEKPLRFSALARLVLCLRLCFHFSCFRETNSGREMMNYCDLCKFISSCYQKMSGKVALVQGRCNLRDAARLTDVTSGKLRSRFADEVSQAAYQ